VQMQDRPDLPLCPRPWQCSHVSLS
jgi:hypothetical protein